MSALLVAVYDLLARRGSIGARPELGEAAAGKPPGRQRTDKKLLIEDQLRRTMERFGKSTVAAAGCEVIALYNALCWRLGEERISLSQLIGIFEKRGMALGGRWGTSPKAIYRWLRKSGFHVVLETRRRRFEETSRDCDSVIVSYFNNRRNPFRGVHTICMTRETGGFMLHNLTEDGHVHGPYEGVLASLKQATGGKAGPICMIGMKEQEGSARSRDI